MKLDDALAGVARLGLDTAPIIYFIETHPRYNPIMAAVFQRIALGSITGVTSTVSLSEVLVQPLLRSVIPLANAYRDLLLHSSNLDTLPIDAIAAESAAGFRARYGLRTPDALQIAVAVNAGCEAFLTNDMQLKRVTEIRVLALDDLEP